MNCLTVMALYNSHICKKRTCNPNTGMIFFSYLTDFSYFCLNKKSKSCRTWSEQVKNDLFERGCRWFQLFFNDFQLFYFLTRIIPANKYTSLFNLLTIFKCTILGIQSNILNFYQYMEINHKCT